MKMTVPKWLRYGAAGFVLTATTSVFTADLIAQLTQEPLTIDGPLAWFSSYTNALNKIVFAIALATLLIVDFKIRSVRGRKIIRYGSLACVILSLIGFGFLVREHVFFHSMHGSHGMIGLMLRAYALQFAYIVTALTIYLRMREPVSTQTGSNDA